MAEYRLSPRAQRDLDEVFDHIVVQWGLPQAMRYTDLIEAACADLAETPQRAQGCANIRPATGGAVSSSMSSIFARRSMASPSSASRINAWTPPVTCNGRDVTVIGDERGIARSSI